MGVWVGTSEDISHLGSEADLISQTDGPLTEREEYGLAFQYKAVPVSYFFQYKSLSLSIHLGEVKRNPKGRVALLKAHSIIPQEQQNKGVKDGRKRQMSHSALAMSFLFSSN